MFVKSCDLSSLVKLGKVVSSVVKKKSCVCKVLYFFFLKNCAEFGKTCKSVTQILKLCKVCVDVCQVL